MEINSPANAGDSGSIPGLKSPPTAEQLSPALQLLSPRATAPDVFAQCQQKPLRERPVHCRSSPIITTRDSSCKAVRTQRIQTKKINMG